VDVPRPAAPTGPEDRDRDACGYRSNSESDAGFPLAVDVDACRAGRVRIEHKVIQVARVRDVPVQLHALAADPRVREGPLEFEAGQQRHDVAGCLAARLVADVGQRVDAAPDPEDSRCPS
jgi:hypothetical protein